MFALISETDRRIRSGLNYADSINHNYVYGVFRCSIHTIIMIIIIIEIGYVQYVIRTLIMTFWDVPHIHVIYISTRTVGKY